MSAGSDPMAALTKYSEDKSARVDSISLGQGQGPKAEAMVVRAQKQGSWVVLQNCHLCVKWMPTLEKIVEDTDGKKCHKGYRLWCTTYPSPDFPSAILQNAVKMTIEPPSGLRANMMGSYMADPLSDMDFFCSVEKSEEWHKFLFSLCFFHALIQERIMFGALGFNNAYEFNASDLRISIQQLAMFLDLYDEIPYKALNYCTGQCNYGGRVTDDKDRRCLMTILQRFFSPEILEDGCKLSKDGAFSIPGEGDYQSYIDFIDNLPMTVRFVVIVVVVVIAILLFSFLFFSFLCLSFPSLWYFFHFFHFFFLTSLFLFFLSPLFSPLLPSSLPFFCR